MAFFVPLFPDGDNLIDGDVANLIFVVLQLQHAAFGCYYFTTQARRAITDNIDLVAHKFRE